jgi:phage terminase large subunit
LSEVEVRLPRKLIPVFQGPADVRGAYGGRGSAKTRSFAKMAAVIGMRFGQAGISGQVLCARQYMNSLEDSSLEEVKRAIEDEPFLSAYFDVGEKFIKSHDGRISFTFAGLDRSIESIKSKGRILLCWVDEAEPVAESAWTTLIPTLREEGEGWNAERKAAPVERFAKSDDPLIKVVELNYRDNPRFPAKLERDRQRDLKERPDQYPHIWDGEFVKALAGAYFAKDLIRAKAEDRISRVAADELLTLRAYWDIGGTGAKADACALWIVQFVGKEIRVLDYHEQSGQPLAAHVAWLRDHGYGKAAMVLPHDGETHDKVHKVTYASALRDAGFSVRTIPNMGAGAASRRIEAVRRVFPQVWFNEATTEAGRDALGWYHEKTDEKRGIGLGPEHDWASHGADAFGLMAVDYEQNPATRPVKLTFASEF